MKHVSTDVFTYNGKGMPTLDNATCMYLSEVIDELATVLPKGQTYTFSTPTGKIVFEMNK